MKSPRTIKIIRLMSGIVPQYLRNENLLLRGNLGQLDALGGIYIKFLQMIVLNLDTRQQDNWQELLGVYEHSQPDKLNIHKHLYKLKIDTTRFAHVESTPFATGSFGQVYKAQLVTGETVVIKVLRPSVMRYIHYDLALLRILTSIYSVVDKQKILNFKEIYRQFRKTCLQEINYLHEAEVADLYHRTYQNHPTMVIPKTYIDLSNHGVITQEFIDGLSVTEALALQNQGHDARAYVSQTLGSDLYQQLYTVGYELLSKALLGDLLHADPHPGNIILLPHNRVALIDFGMSTTMQQNRTAFYEMLLQYQAYYSNNLAIEDFALAALKFLAPELHSAIAGADSLLQSKQPTHTSLLEKVRQTTWEVAQEDYTTAMIESLLERKMIMKVLFFAINKGNRFGFHFDLKAFTLLKADQAYLTLCGQFDHNAEIISRVIDEVVVFAKANLDKIVDQQPLELKPSEALEVLSKWIDKMSRHDPYLMSKLINGYLK